MKNALCRKGLVVGIIVLFVGVGIILGISGSSKRVSDGKSVQYSQPDLLWLAPNSTWMGNDIYDAPPPTKQIGLPFWHFLWFFYVFQIEIQNDGPDWLYNSTIQTTKLSSGPAFGGLLYPKEDLNGGLAMMPFTSGPNRMMEFSPGQSVIMTLIVIKFGFSQVQVQVDVFCPDITSQERDSIKLHT
jgi:hypothetical protein